MDVVVVHDDAQMSNAQFEARFRHRSPARLAGRARQWPALTKWRDPATLTDYVGRDTVVPVLVAKDGQHFFKNALCDQVDMRFGDVVDAIFRPNDAVPRRLYCRLPLTQAFVDDVALLAELVAAPGQPNPIKVANCGVWLSTPGNMTPLHYDLCHGLLVQIVGRKRWHLFSPDDYRSLYPASSVDPNPLSSQVCLDRWLANDPDERRKFPKVANADMYRCELDPGDVMYTPPFWWHHVETLEPSISLLLPFDKRPDEPVHPCAL